MIAVRTVSLNTWYTAIALAAVCLCANDARAQREQGVRLRVFAIGQPIATHDRLADGQSANADVTLPQFAVAADSATLDEGGEHYMAEYTALLRVDKQGAYEFEVNTKAECELRIEARVPEQTMQASDRIRLSIELRPGNQVLQLMQRVNDGPAALSVRWRPPGASEWQAIPADRLSCEKFHFRPTQPGNKRLATLRDRPGKHMRVEGLYPSLELLTLHEPQVGVPVGGLDVLSDGRLVVAVFEARRLRAPYPQPNADGELWLYSGVDGDGATIERRMIAGRLYEPSGVCCVGESIYVSQRAEVTRFDYDKARDEWLPTTIATGWRTNDFHALSFGLVHVPGTENHPGYLYMARGTGLGQFKNPPNHGAVWRIDLAKPSGQNVEPVTGGHRTPNGIGIGPEGELFVTDNQGEWTPCNELNHIKQNAFYGFYHRMGGESSATPFQPDGPEPRAKSTTEAAVWMPQDEIANSPSEPIMIPESWPFAGQMLVGDVKYGGVNRVSLEEVDGVWQGAAYRFTQGLEGGVNRLAFGRDGSLYVGGIGGDHATTWNWVNPQGQKTYQGLQRLRPSDDVVFDMELVEAMPNGLRITFTKPVASDWLADPANYTLRQWTYQATGKYGGAKHNLVDLRATSATPSDNGRQVSLVIPGLREGYLVYLLTEPHSLEGESLWSTEVWYTLRKVPKAGGAN